MTIIKPTVTSVRNGPREGFDHLLKNGHVPIETTRFTVASWTWSQQGIQTVGSNFWRRRVQNGSEHTYHEVNKTLQYKVSKRRVPKHRHNLYSTEPAVFSTADAQGWRVPHCPRGMI